MFNREKTFYYLNRISNQTDNLQVIENILSTNWLRKNDRDRVEKDWEYQNNHQCDVNYEI